MSLPVKDNLLVHHTQQMHNLLHDPCHLVPVGCLSELRTADIFQHDRSGN
jgi:hypothetical protein